jgi:hypothetical protein
MTDLIQHINNNNTDIRTLLISQCKDFFKKKKSVSAFAPHRGPREEKERERREE